MILTLEDKKFLIKVARDTLWAKLADEEKPVYYKDKEIYKQKKGIFIKMLKNKKTRAYAGILSSSKDLISTIQNITLIAGFSDYRFTPISKEEYNDIVFQIIIVNTIESVKTLNEITPGEDGIMIKTNRKSSVLFPWDLPEEYIEKEFINTVFYKADLDKKDINNAEIFKITNTLIDERTLEVSPLLN